MGKSRKNKPDTILSPLLMQQYLKGKLSAQEMHRVEKILLEDEFQQDAMEGFVQLAHPELFQKNITDLRGRLVKRVTQSKTTLPFYLNRNWQVAAALAFLVLVSGLIYTVVNTSIEEEKSGIAIQQKSEKDSAASQPLADQYDNEASSQSKHFFEPKDQANENESNTEQTPIPRNKSNIQSREPEPLSETQQNEQTIPDLTHKPADETIATSGIKQPEETLAESMDEAKEEFIEKKSSNKSMAAYNAGATPTIQLNGKVISSEDNSALPGVNVIIRNTTQGTTTNANGNFTIAVPPGEQDLMLSFIGFTTVEKQYHFTNDTTLQVKLSPDTHALSEVVAVDYGSGNEIPDVEYTSAEPIPNYKGFNDYLKKNLIYPEAALEHDIQGKVKIEFNVEPDGSLTDLQVIKSLGYGCDEEALRLLREGPTWKAALKNGQPVQQKTVVNIKFKRR